MNSPNSGAGADDLGGRVGTVARIGLIIGPLAFILMMLMPPPDGMPPVAWKTAAVGVLMGIWWITEAIPIPATAMLPLALFPLLGIATIAKTTAPYANPVIYLFLGGFLIAMALESVGLHKRLALAILAVVGTRPANLVLGFMIATAFISMWVSNTATVVMMLPMATSVITVARARGEEAGLAHNRSFEVALMLGVAYAASIGGLGTLIGTAPNALLAAFMSETYGVHVGFVEWMMIGVPIVVISIPVSWWIMTKFVHRMGSDPIAGGAAFIHEERTAIGRISRAEWIVGAITLLTAAAWVTRPIYEKQYPALSDTVIAVIGALLLFLVPVSLRPLRVALSWKQAERLPWAVLLLFGGGLSLADAIQESGLAMWIGGQLAVVGGWPVLLVMLAVTAVVIMLTEFTSNTATAAAFLPVVGSLAIGLGMDPLMLAIPATLAASCGFMMPVGTPPNAIVYGTGYMTIGDMAKAGIWINLFFVILIPVIMMLIAGAAFGI